MVDTKDLYSENLLPCPFCGNQPELSQYPRSTHIMCKNCMISIAGNGPWSNKKDLKDIPDWKMVQDTFDKWNTRNGILYQQKLDNAYSRQIKNYGS